MRRRERGSPTGFLFVSPRVPFLCSAPEEPCASETHAALDVRELLLTSESWEKRGRARERQPSNRFARGNHLLLSLSLSPLRLCPCLRLSFRSREAHERRRRKGKRETREEGMSGVESLIYLFDCFSLTPSRDLVSLTSPSFFRLRSLR